MEKQNRLMWNTEGVVDLGKKKKVPYKYKVHYTQSKQVNFYLPFVHHFFFFFFFVRRKQHLQVISLQEFSVLTIRRTLAEWKILFHMSHKSNIQLNKVRIGYQIHQNVYIWQTFDTCVSTLKAPVYKSIEPKLVPH